MLDTAKGEGKAERQREVLWKINAEVHEENGTLDHGIRLSDGDGTVRRLVALPACSCSCPSRWQAGMQEGRMRRAALHQAAPHPGGTQVPLISLGSLCAKHWREKKLNPSGFEVVSREYKHEPTQRNMFDIRCPPWQRAGKQRAAWTACG